MILAALHFRSNASSDDVTGLSGLQHGLHLCVLVWATHHSQCQGFARTHNTLLVHARPPHYKFGWVLGANATVFGYQLSDHNQRHGITW